MKKLLLISILLVSFCVILPAQDSTGVQTPVNTGFHFDIWAIIGVVLAAGVGGWLVYRGNKLKTLLQTIVAAAQDNKISETEFQEIIKEAKDLVAKKQ